MSLSFTEGKEAGTRADTVPKPEGTEGLAQAGASLRTRPQTETDRQGSLWEPSMRGRQSTLVSLGWQTVEKRRLAVSKYLKGRRKDV